MSKSNIRKYGPFALLGLALVANAIFLYHNAFRAFNLLDMGSFLDASWRIYRGQTPYVDFFYYAGPLHLYLNALFFHLFGFGKTAIFAHLLANGTAAIMLIFFMLWRKIPAYLLLTVMVLAIPSFNWSISHPWHDHTAHLWGIIGLFFLVKHLNDENKVQRAMIIASACGVLAYISKSNVGAAWGAAFALVAVAHQFRAKTIVGYIIGLVIGSILAVIIIRHPILYFEQSLVHSSMEGKARFAHLLSPPNWFLNYYWITVLVVVINFFQTPKKNWELLFVFLGVAFVALFSINTGGMIKPPNNFLWGVHMALAFLLLHPMRDTFSKPIGKTIHRSSIVALIILSLAQTALSVHYGKKLEVWAYTVKNPVGTYALQSDPLKGWLFLEPEGKALDGLAQFINQNIREDESLLVLTNMYILYALTGRESFKNMPFVFLENQMPVGNQIEETRQTILNNPPDWIVIHITTPKTEMRYLNLQKEIMAMYQPHRMFGVYLLLKKN